MTICTCTKCDCSVEGLHEFPHWICPFCKAGNHITENNLYADIIKK